MIIKLVVWFLLFSCRAELYIKNKTEAAFFRLFDAIDDEMKRQTKEMK